MPYLFALLALFFMTETLSAETLKNAFAAKITLNTAKNEPQKAVFNENQTVLINIEGDLRFYRGIEIELIAPQNLAANLYSIQFYSGAKINVNNSDGQFFEAQLLHNENLTGKISTVFQIPFRGSSGLRPSPYVTIFSEPLNEHALPIVLLITDTAGNSNIRFEASVQLIPGDEGAAHINLRYPQLLRDRPVTILIDDDIVDEPGAFKILREGEHQLLIVSEDYRSESRRFIVERGKISEITVTLKDTTPVLLFEAPDRALIFINNRRIINTDTPYLVNPGIYDIKIQVSDYTIIKTVQVQKGKTYRIAFTVDMSVNEE